MKPFPWLISSLIAVPLLFSLPGRASSQPPDRDSDLATQARTILRKHCLNCHGKVGPGGVNLLDRSALVGKLILAGDPDGSLLLDLVDGGSMPPGHRRKLSREERSDLREWVRAGADPFPSEMGRDYLLNRLVKDFDKLSPESKANARYVSFNHLLGKSGVDPSTRATALVEVLKNYSAKPKPSLVSIEGSGTVFRIDLKELGWHQKPFKGEELNLFDLVLLEYPYGVLPKLPTESGLARFLEKTKQVRPIPFVHGDWLIHALKTDPLHSDFRQALKKPDSDPPREAKGGFAAPVDWDDAVNELETNPDKKRLKIVLKSIPDLEPLAEEKSVGRSVWERNFLEVVRLLGAGLPILPLDGLTWSNPQPDPGLKANLRLISLKDAKLLDPPGKDRIVGDKDQIRIWIRANKEVTFELVYTDPWGAKKLLTSEKENDFLNPNEPLISNAPRRSGSSGSANRRYLTLFAYLEAGLKDTTYPKGKMLRKGTVSDRFVHPIYEWTSDAKGFKGPAPGKMVKVVLPFTIVKD